MPNLLLPYLQDWNLLADGPSIETGNAILLPVQWHGQAAMLKVSTSPEEIQGYDLLEWWQGHGAAYRPPGILRMSRTPLWHYRSPRWRPTR